MAEQWSADQIRSVLAERGFIDYAFVKREFKYLAQVLNQDEHPLAAVSGLMGGNSILCLLTNRQLWFVDHGLVYGVKSSTIPLAKVNAVSYQSHLVFSDIEITNGADVTLIKNVTRSSAQKFVKAVNDYLVKFRENQNTGNQNSSIGVVDNSLPSQLSKLKDLLDAGALTQAEFNQAKQKLLGTSSVNNTDKYPDQPKSDDLGGSGIGL